MTLLEKLDYLIKINNIKNLHKLSELSKVPYTTYRTMFQRGVDNISLDTARKICDFFDLTLDELLRDEIDLPNYIENYDKNAKLKVKREYPKPNYSEKTKKNKEAFEVAYKYENEIVDLSQYDKDTKDLILKIIEMNKRNKKNDI